MFFPTQNQTGFNFNRLRQRDSCFGVSARAVCYGCIIMMLGGITAVAGDSDVSKVLLLGGGSSATLGVIGLVATACQQPSTEVIPILAANSDVVDAPAIPNHPDEEAESVGRDEQQEVSCKV